ncbi:hypothetical protein AB3X93_16440 [Paraburkholderia sp. BR14262]|uniref:hypothetical protein n=1 Tax=Paraburkholderia sp. BR14262 TaxID=3236999 RepID=UPI0034CD9B3C
MRGVFSHKATAQEAPCSDLGEAAATQSKIVTVIPAEPLPNGQPLFAVLLGTSTIIRRARWLTVRPHVVGGVPMDNHERHTYRTARQYVPDRLQMVHHDSG